MDGHNIIVSRLGNRDFFKILLNTDVGIKGVSQKDMGGIDIVNPMWTFNQAGITKPLPLSIRDSVFNNDESKVNIPISQYGQVECIIFREDIAIRLLDIMYPRWRDKKHPLLF